MYRIVTSAQRFLHSRRTKILERHLSLSALEVGIETVTGNQLPGNYVEFGVYKGASFSHAYHHFKKFDTSSASQRKFVAVDSFEGLPDEFDDSKPEQYFKGAYAASLNTFLTNSKRRGVPQDAIVVRKGFYSEIEDLELDKDIALAYIDCDLRESAEHALRLCSPYLQKGTVIVFDDFFRYDGASGIRKAWEHFLVQSRWEAQLLHLYRRIAFVIS